VVVAVGIFALGEALWVAAHLRRRPAHVIPVGRPWMGRADWGRSPGLKPRPRTMASLTTGESSGTRWIGGSTYGSAMRSLASGGACPVIRKYSVAAQP
jgi:TctA family transporter